MVSRHSELCLFSSWLSSATCLSLNVLDLCGEWAVVMMRTARSGEAKDACVYQACMHMKFMVIVFSAG